MNIHKLTKDCFLYILFYIVYYLLLLLYLFGFFLFDLLLFYFFLLLLFLHLFIIYFGMNLVGVESSLGVNFDLVHSNGIGMCVNMCA